MGRRRVALVVVGLLAVTTVAVGVASEQRRAVLGGDSCALDSYAVTATNRSPASVDDEIVRHETLSGAKRALVERALAEEGEEVPLRNETERAAARDLRNRTLTRNGTVYLDGVGTRCSWVAGAPLWLDPLLFPFVLLYYLLSGPLLPVVVLGVAGAVAYAVGEWARY